MLIEQFVEKLPADIRLWLSDKDINTLTEVAKQTDIYVTQPKTARSQMHTNTSQHNYVRPAYNRSPDIQRKSFNSSHDNNCNEFRSMRINSSRSPPQNNQFNSIECAYCHRKGHLISNCFKLKAVNEQQKQNTVPKDVGLVATQNKVDVCSHNLSSTHKLNPLNIPYCHAGCLVSPKGQCKPIVILRDTGATLSLLRCSAVSFDDYIETGSVQDI